VEGEVVHKVGDGKLTQSWNDVWLQSSPLRICYPKLFEVCDNKEGSMAECAARGWQLGLRCMLGPEEMREWTDLQSLLGGVSLSNQEDVLSWGLTTSKLFATRSLYRFMTNGGMDSKMARKIWKCKIPLKIRVFLWQTFQNKVQTSLQLKSMN
jgi:hypothetical protein